MVSTDSVTLKHKTISFAYETATILSLFEMNSIERHFPSGPIFYTPSPQLGHTHSAVGDVARSL